MDFDIHVFCICRVAANAVTKFFNLAAIVKLHNISIIEDNFVLYYY
jgi:hypothetical protein